MRAFLVWSVGLLVGGAICFGGIMFGYSQWNREVYAAKHPPGWVKRTAKVESVSAIRYNVRDYQNNLVDPPVVSVQLQYRDYKNYLHTIPVNMAPESVVAGQNTILYVRNDESVFVPHAEDWNNQVDSSANVPVYGKAYSETWPSMGYVLGISVGLLGGAVAAWLAYLLSESITFPWRGRLGTR